MECLKVHLLFAVTGYCVAVPFLVGQGNWNSGARGHPASIGSPRVGRPYFHSPPFRAHYPPIGYDFFDYQGRKYPQAPNFPVSPKESNYPQFGNNLPPTTLEQDDMNIGFEKPEPTLEQVDMNKGIELSELPRNPSYIPFDGEIYDSDSEEDYSDNVMPASY